MQLFHDINENDDQTPESDDVKKFECTICVEQFAFQSKLNEHVSSFHVENELEQDIQENDFEEQNSQIEDFQQ